MKRRHILIFVTAAGLIFALLSLRQAMDRPHGAASVAPITAVQPPADAPARRPGQVPPLKKVIGNVAERIPDSVMETVNQQEPYNQRLAAVERIADLSAPGAQTALIDYLLQQLPDMDSDRRAAEYELRNNMLNKLREYSSDPGAVTEALLKIYRDPAQGDVLRAYAVQHMSGWVRTGAPAPGEREQLLAAVRDAAGKVNNPAIGGAGLIALREVGPKEDAGAFAMKALASGSACPESRISAFQVCAELGVESAVEPARTALADRNAPGILRMSAVHALARLGGPADERLLRELAASGSGQSGGRLDGDELVRNAARLALASRQSERKGK